MGFPIGYQYRARLRRRWYSAGDQSERPLVRDAPCGRPLRMRSIEAILMVW